MGPFLEDPAVLNKEDLIGVPDGGKPVGDHEHGADAHHFFKRILNENFGFGVDIRGRLVEDHHRGTVNDGPGEGEKLPLSGGEVVPPLPHLFVKTALQLVYKAVGVDVAAGAQDLLIRDALLPEDDVAADGSRKEEYVLKHLPEMAAQGGNFDLSDINAVDKDLALLEFIVPADK